MESNNHIKESLNIITKKVKAGHCSLLNKIECNLNQVELSNTSHEFQSEIESSFQHISHITL